MKDYTFVPLSIFDEKVDRRGMRSAKWDGTIARTGRKDILPLSLADMDFKSPQCVLDALKEKVESGFLGYETDFPALHAAIENWMWTRHKTRVQAGISTPGVVGSLIRCAQWFAPKTSGVALFTPIYGHFFEAAQKAGLPVWDCPMLYRDHTYQMDLNRLEEGFKKGVRLLLFCNPHNPVGRVWRMEELKALVSLCKKYQVQIVSDEIHADLTLPGYTHICMMNLDPSSVCLLAPSKTFNLAGLRHANLFAGEELMPVMQKAWKEERIQGGNTLSAVAEYAAYTYGAPWLDSLRKYLSQNSAYIQSELQSHFSGIQAAALEGTYLMWLDFSSLGLSQETLVQRMEEGGLSLNDGLEYGENGRGFLRLNIGTQRANLALFLERLEKIIVKNG